MTESQDTALEFSYSPLSENQIRVATVLAGPDDSPLRVELQTFDVQSLPDYHALSYCWGEGPIDKECLCDDHVSSGCLWLSDNLWQALRDVRHNEKDVLLWADQLCIDQRNDEEKVQQVRLMGQIYSKALRVAIWLGPADEETMLAFNLMDDVYSQIEEQAKLLSPELAANIMSEGCPLVLSSADSPEWVAFRRLFKRQWFSRLWIFQEAVLAQKAFFKCGEHFITLDRLAIICEVVNIHDRQTPDHESRIKGVDDFVYSVWHCHAIRSKWSSHPSIAEQGPMHLELLNLMKRVMGQKSSVPHDFVYALLGVASDVQTLSIPIDYSQTFRELFEYMTKAFVNRYCDLTVLSLVSILPSELSAAAWPRSLPSWVPDYRYALERNNERVSLGPLSLEHGRERHYSSTGFSGAFTSLDSGHTLSVSGIFVGQIKWLSDPDHNGEGNVTIGTNVLSGGQWSIMAERCACEGLYAPTGEPIQKAFSRLRVVDYIPEEGDADDRRARQHPFEIPEPGVSILVRNANGERLAHIEIEDKVTVCIVRATTRQRFYITNTGYMGLCHQSCVVGDQVWLLMGGHMPFILRQLETEPITFHFKGESYVHGIMDGELLYERFGGNSGKGRDEWLTDLQNGIPFDTETLVLS